MSSSQAILGRVVLSRDAEAFLKSFRPEDVIVVADAGMLSEENLSYLEEEGYSYIVRSRTRSLTQRVKTCIRI